MKRLRGTGARRCAPTVIVVFLLLISLSFAGQKTLNFAWQQDLPDPNDMAGWKFYQATQSGGPWTLFDTIIYVSPQTEYTTSKVIIVPDGAVTTLYFAVTAFDISANESGRSNEVMARIDFQLPSVPVQFKITVTTP